MTREKVCANCKYFLYDNSVGAADCNKADDIEENLFEKHFVNDEPGCPFFEELEEVDYVFDIVDDDGYDEDDEYPDEKGTEYLKSVAENESNNRPKTLLENVAEWDKAIEKKGYIN